MPRQQQLSFFSTTNRTTLTFEKFVSIYINYVPHSRISNMIKRLFYMANITQSILIKSLKNIHVFR